MRTTIMGVAICTLALAFVSCDDKGSSPTTDSNNGTGKEGGLLAVCGSPVVFGGIDHCPIGNATLTNNGTSLDVTGLTASDGVASDLGTVHEWSQEANVGFDAAGGTYVEYHSISGGVTTSTTRLQQIGTSNSMAVTADFTGGVAMQYTVNLYADGSLIASQTGCTIADKTTITFTPAAARGHKDAVISDFRTWADVMELFHPRLVGEPNEGACVWVTQTVGGSKFPSVQLPNGNSYSNIDKVEIVESTAPGHYPYHSFDRVDVVGTIYGFNILSETAT